MSADPLREEEEAVAAEGPELVPTLAEARRHARSVSASLSGAQAADTESDSAGVPQMVRTWLQGRVTAFAAREFDVIHGPPPTLARMHERHRIAASHWSAALISKPRMAWGLLHTALAAVLYAVLDALFSPFGALFAVLFIAAAIHYFQF